MGSGWRSLFFLFIWIVIVNFSITAQQTQYRRGIELREGYQPYKQKYQGKDLTEEKRRLFPLESTGVWTELNPKVPRVDYIGVHFVNKDTGWAVGDLGALIKTTDGGDNWTISGVQTTTLLLKVHSYNGQVVIATGYDGLILRSTDGGETFEQVPSGVGTGMDLWGIQMVNDTLGWVCGLYQTLLKTTDAGQTWEQIYPGLNQHYWSLDFLNEQYGMIACGGGKVLKTTNGGYNWTEIQAGDTRALYTIDIIDSLHIAAAGAGTGMGSKNIYSSDGGMNWTENGNLIYENGVNCISFINTDTGYVVGENWAIRKTTNRGQSWFASDPMYTEWWLDLLAGGEGYAVGNSLKIYKTTGGYDNWEKLFLTDNFNDVFFIDEYKGFIVISDPSRLYKTENGGTDWDSIPGAPGGNCLLFLDSLTGFIGGYTIYKTINGGVSWYPTNGITNSIRKIFFINSQTGWAAGGQRVFKTTDGGENWIEQLNNIVSYFYSTFFIDSLSGWAVSPVYQGIFSTIDGGDNWTQRSDIPIYEAIDVYFSSPLNGWILSGNELYYTTDGGNIWQLDPQVYTYTSHFEAISKSHFIITGTNIYESVDTGQVWQNITGEIGTFFTRLQAPKLDLAYAVGPNGLIIKYEDTTYVPVDLFTFTATVYNKEVILNWSTATETNNRGFEVQKSQRSQPKADPPPAEKVKSQKWQQIGFVEGNGTTTERYTYRFTDNDVIAGKYEYRLKQIDFDGSFDYSKEVEVDITGPQEFSLGQNYPNPFNPVTTISYELSVKSLVRLKVYNTLGEEVATLINEEKPAGNYSVRFNRSSLPSGVYIYRLTAGNYSAAKKLLLIK